MNWLIAILLALGVEARAGKDPRTIAGLKLDMDSTKGLSVSSGLVDSWISQASTAFTFTQAGAPRPFTTSAAVDGVTGINFNGSHSMVGSGNYSALISSANTHTVILRYNNDSVTGAREYLSNWNAANVSYFYGGNGANFRFTDRWYESCGADADLLTGTHTLAWVAATTDAHFYVDGVLADSLGSALDTNHVGCSSSSLNAAQVLYIGVQGTTGGEFMDAKLRRLLVYDAALDAGQIKQVHDFFRFGASGRRGLELEGDLLLDLSKLFERAIGFLATEAWAQPVNQRSYGDAMSALSKEEGARVKFISNSLKGTPTPSASFTATPSPVKPTFTPTPRAK